MINGIYSGYSRNDQASITVSRKQDTVNDVKVKQPGAAVSFLYLLLFLVFSPATVSAEGQALGINLAGLHDWNTELPFVDVFRLSRTWVSQQDGKPWGKGPPVQLDEHGWITHLPRGTWAESCIVNIREGRYPHGVYTLLYQGKGRIEIANVRGKVVQVPGKIVFTLTGEEGIVWIRIKETDPADYIRNIRVYMPGYGNPPATEILRPGFLTRWQGMQAVRFMEFLDINNSTQQHWQDRVRLDDATWTIHGAPIEIAVEISNRLGASPWFCIPHLADDNYVRQFARLVRDLLDPELKIYLEYSNETWNPMFRQNQYCREQGTKMGLANNPVQAGLRFASLRSVQIFKIWQEVFDGNERLVRVMASQAANPGVSEEKLNFQAAYKECDALAVAPYITLNVSPRSTPSLQEVRQWSLPHLLQMASTSLLDKSIRWMRQSRAVADRYHVKLIAYEGGQHLVGFHGAENDAQLTELLLSANRAPEMAQLYRRYLEQWQTITDNGLFCLWLSVERWSKWGAWGLLEFYDQSDDESPKFMAVRSRLAPADLRKPQPILKAVQ